MRLAFLSPLPPAPTGIADYAADLLALLAAAHQVDAFCDQAEVDGARLPPGIGVEPARAFGERHRARPYDLALYQMGNGRDHDFLYDHVSRWPGVLVLHDLVLHHARAASFLESEPVRAWRARPGDTAAREAARPSLARWREELEYTYPGAGDRLFEVQVGTVGRLLPFAYPLFRIPVEASRLVVVHNELMARAVREEVPGAAVAVVPQPVERQAVAAGAREALRRRLGFAEDDLVVGTFGLVTPEKQVETVARAVARVAPWSPGVRLLVVGPVPDRPRLDAQLARTGVAGRAVVTGRIPLEELAAHLESADVVAHLRYPTGRETSAALLRVLAQGRPTVVSDLEHQAEIPADAVVRVDPADEEGALTRAILRLAGDHGARAELGRQAAGFVAARHSRERTARAWDGIVEEARARPDPPARAWPAHWPVADRSAGARPDDAD